MRTVIVTSAGVALLMVMATLGVAFAGSGPCFYNSGSIECSLEKCLHTGPYDMMPTPHTSSGRAFQEMSPQCLGVIQQYCSSHMDKWPCPDFSKWLDIQQFSPAPEVNENLE